MLLEFSEGHSSSWAVEVSYSGDRTCFSKACVRQVCGWPPGVSLMQRVVVAVLVGEGKHKEWPLDT